MYLCLVVSYKDTMVVQDMTRYAVNNGLRYALQNMCHN